MITILLHGFLIFLGLAGGIAVGGGLVALLIVFDLVPRLAQLARAYHLSICFETAIISGALYWTFADIMDWQWRIPAAIGISTVGLFQGVFVGMLAAALTEVMNVIPILAKRMKLSQYIMSFVMAMVLGKIIGSLFDWLYFQW